MQTRMDPDHSLLLSFRISHVEVFDYQLAGLRTEFIRHLISFGQIGFHPLTIYYIREKMLLLSQIESKLHWLQGRESEEGEEESSIFSSFT